MVSSDCERDDATPLTDLRTFIEDEREKDMEQQHSSDAQEDTFDTVIPDKDGTLTNISTAYLSGFLCKSVLKANGCDSCRGGLYSEDTTGIYYQIPNEDAQTLTYPSGNLVKTVFSSISLAEEI